MAGYSKTPLRKKLGVKDGQRLHFIDPPHGYLEWIGPLDDPLLPGAPPYDFVHFFTNRIALLEEGLRQLRHQIAPDGMIWVSWHKKASGLPSEIAEDTIRDTALALGLVDIKVCAVNDVWSGLKLVIRKELR